MQARITIHYQKAPAKQLYLDESREYIIGRGEDCDIVIDTPQMSRRHASMRCNDTIWSISDLESKNGVAVNGRDVKTSRLTSSLWIGLGEQLLRFELRTPEQVEREQKNQRRRFETSLELRRSLRPTSGVTPLLDKVLSSVLQLSGTERGFAMLARGDGDMEVLCSSGVSIEDINSGRFAGSIGAVNHALEAGASVVIVDVQQFAPLCDRPSVIAGGMRALVCLPMRVLDRTIGVIYADSSTVGKLFTELDLEILEGLISHAATALAVAQLDQEIIDLGSVLDEGEVNTARLSQWRDKIPGYRHQVSDGPVRVSKGSVTWSQVAAGFR